MAAGGGSGVAFLGPVAGGLGASAAAAAAAAAAGAGGGGEGVDAGAVVVTNGNGVGAGAASLGPGLRALRIDTDVGVVGRGAEEGDSANSATSASASEIGSTSGVGEEREVWAGELSAVVGLQKRGLRGLMEGRRIREMGRSGGGGGVSGGAGDGERVGLGIA